MELKKLLRVVWCVSIQTAHATMLLGGGEDGRNKRMKNKRK